MTAEQPTSSQENQSQESEEQKFELSGIVAVRGVAAPPVIKGKIYTKEDFYLTDEEIKMYKETYGHYSLKKESYDAKIFHNRYKFSGGIFALDSTLDLGCIVFKHLEREKRFSPFNAVLSIGGITQHAFNVLRDQGLDSFVGLARVPVKKLRSGDNAEISLIPGKSIARIKVTRHIETPNMLDDKR